MKTIIHTLKIISLAFFLTLLIGCGGGGGSSKSADDPIVETPPPATEDPVGENPGEGDETPATTTVSGLGFDGPVYDAQVTFYAIDDIDLANPIGSAITKRDPIGSFDVAIESIPDYFIVKVSGGKDAGPDAVIDDLDKDSEFIMTSIGSKETVEKTFASAATTMIFEAFKADTSSNSIAQKIEDAKESTNKALGITDGTDLTTKDPTKDSVANKAANLIANVVKALPTNDKSKALASTAKILQQSADNNKSVSTINDESFSVTNDFNLSAIANDMNLSQNEQNKVAKVANKLTVLIEETVQAYVPTNELNESAEQKNVQAKQLAFEKVAESLEEATDESEIDEAKIDTLAKKTKEALDIILENNASTLDSNNLDVVLDMVEKNSDKNISALKDTLVQVADTTKKVLANEDTSEKVKSMMKEVFEDIDLNNSNGVESVSELFEDADSIANLEANLDENDRAINTVAQSIVTKANNNEDVNGSVVDDVIVSVNSVDEAFNFLDGKLQVNQNDRIALWLEQAIALNIEQNIDISISLDTLYNDIQTKYLLIENNITRMSALKYAVITSDLNDTVTLNPAPYETKITDLDSYDLLGSLPCIEDKIISAKRSNSLDSLDIDMCKIDKVIVRKEIEPNKTIFRAYTLFTNEETYLIPDFNITIE